MRFKKESPSQQEQLGKQLCYRQAIPMVVKCVRPGVSLQVFESWREFDQLCDLTQIT